MPSHLVIVLLITTLVLVMGLSNQAESAFTSAAFIVGGGTWFLLKIVDPEDRS